MSATPVGRMAAGGVGRVALAGIVLVLAAVVVTASGGGGLGGRLGALFGRHSGDRGKPVSAIEVAAPAPGRHASTAQRAAPPRRAWKAPALRVRPRHPAAVAPRRVPRAPAPQPAPSPAPPAQRAPPLPQGPPPPAAPAGHVEHAAQTVRDTVAPAAPQLQPALNQAVSGVGRACGLIGGCP